MVEVRPAPEFEFPDHLRVFDPARHSSEAQYHLDRCRALPRNMKRERTDEIRAAVAATARA